MKRLMVSMLVLAAMLSAALVEVDRAQTVAQNYYKNYAPVAEKGNTVQKVLTKEYMGQPTWYVFQFTKGFVIVAADDAVRSVLGYSFDGTITEDLNDLRNPFINRFDSYDKEIVHVIREKGVVDAAAQKEWKDIENNIFPKASKAVIIDALVETNWGQGWPWSGLCPAGTPVGCVATAMHMIMRFHQGPAAGAGSKTYNDVWGTTQGSHTVNFANATYNWTLMAPLTSGQVTTQAQADEMAELSYHCGVAVSMDYETAGSGAYIADVPAALETYFGFHTDATYATVGTVTDPTTFSATIQANLNAYRPIEWGGTGPDGGHAFILDGYTDDYWYHFNWGWNGSYNGWYQLTALTPGGSDFSSSQNCAHSLRVNGDQINWPYPTNLTGVISSGEDVALSWTRPAGVKLGTLTGYKIFRKGVQIGAVGASTTTYNDLDLSAGTYTYTVKATYTTPDGESLISNAWVATITANTNFPVATGLSATTMGRTSIDLAWSKPYVGVIYWQTGFEIGSGVTGWTFKRTIDYPPTSRKISGVKDDFTKADVTDGWFLCDINSFGEAQYMRTGDYSMGIGYTAPNYSWAMGPSITVPAGCELRYWHWLFGNATYQTTTYVTSYTGTLGQANPSLNLTQQLAFVDVGTTTPTNVYATEVVRALPAATQRICWVYMYTDGYQMAVDDILIGTAVKRDPEVSNAPYASNPVRYATGTPADNSGNAGSSVKATKADQPTGYQVYRNGALATTISGGSVLTWSDGAFADGWNEYFVKAVYPTGTSIASDRAEAYIIANPVPGFLEGVLNGANVDLTWYAPLHLPPHWFGYIESLDAYFDNIASMTGTWARRRTVFTAARLGMGYEYPFTVDTLAAAFYEGDVVWTDPNFTFTITTTNYAGTADSTIWGPSAVQTAVSDMWTDLALPTQYTMNWGWYVILDVNDDGTPSSLVSTHAGGQTASSTYYGGDGTYAAGWYSISYGEAGDPGDWAILCYGQGSVDTWYFNKNETTTDRIAISPTKVMPAERKYTDEIINNAKAMVKYNVWRNGVDIGDATLTSFTDTAPVNGDNVYEISAVYSTPTGESAKCASVTVNVAATTPNPPTNVVTSLVGGNVLINWDDMAGATQYVVYSSATPYGTFAQLTTVAASQYTYTPTATKMFFYITSSNGKTAAPKTIEIAKPASAR